MSDELSQAKDYIVMLKMQIGDLYVANREKDIYIQQLQGRIQELNSANSTPPEGE